MLCDGAAPAALALLQRVQRGDLLPPDAALTLLPSSSDSAARLAVDTCAAARLVKQLDIALAACHRALTLLQRADATPRQRKAGGEVRGGEAGLRAGEDEDEQRRDELVSTAHFNTGVTLFDRRAWAESVAVIYVCVCV